MISELMLILTIIGAGIIFMVWSNSRKKKRAEQDRQDVVESTNEFKLELEKTANEIIGRMETQAAHLENLLDDSERNRAQLEGRVAELKKLLKRTENQSTEIRDLLERLDDAEEDVGTMQKQMDAIEKKINAAINVQIPQQPPLINSMITPAPITQPVMNPMQTLITPPPILRTSQPVQTPPSVQVSQPVQVQQPVQAPPPPAVEKTVEKPAEDFAKVLEKEVAKPVTAPPDRNSIVLSQEVKRPAKVVEAEPVRIETTRKVSGTIAERQARVLAERQKKTAPKKSEAIRQAVAAINNAAGVEPVTVEIPVETPKPPEKLQELKKRVEKKVEPSRADTSSESANIRDMLLAGKTVEEIARETGLGRGAIELVQQMTKRQLERK